MTALTELLEQKQVRRVLVVDDAYDPLPKASDLSLDQEEWRNFFDDLVGEDEEILREIAPEYDHTDAAQLPESDSFVAAVWINRERLRPELIGPVLSRYQDDMAQDRVYLDQLTGSLEGLGLHCETAGRNFEAQASTADLIVIDLFLGSVQDAGAMGQSKSKLKQVIEARRSSPPLVILMSRSGRLEEKREEFRDDSGLLESGFRIVRKAELAGDSPWRGSQHRYHRHFAYRMAADCALGTRRNPHRAQYGLCRGGQTLWRIWHQIAAALHRTDAFHPS